MIARSFLLSLFAGAVCFSLSARPVDGTRIAWDRSSEVRIASYGNYPRVIRLGEDSFLAVFEQADGVSVSESKDLKVWSTPRTVIHGHSRRQDGADYRLYVANPELCLTRDGTLLLAANFRPFGHPFYPFSIVLLRSSDLGKTWSEPDVLYSAGREFHNGCWEPSFLQLPDGSIHIYFANEGPYRHSDEQEISVMTSRDDGKTWSRPVAASFRQGHRDGMPVAAISGNDIVLAVEDNVGKEFKPYIVRTSLDSPWTEPVGGFSEFREKALADAVPDESYMGAPYLVSFPSGEVVLSYQTNDGRSHDWELSCMEVAVSDSAATGFSKRTRPFDVPLDKEGKWNSLFRVDDNTVAALTSTDKDGAKAPHIVKGYLIRNGILSADSESRNALFVGSRTCDNLTAGVGYARGTFVFRADVKDGDVTSGDGVTFFLDVTGRDNVSPQNGVYRVSVDGVTGESLVYEGNDGQWKEISSSGVRAEVSAHSDGYGVRISFDAGRKHVSSRIRKTFPADHGVRISVCHSNASSDGISYSEHLVHSLPDDPSTWHRMFIRNTSSRFGRGL